MFEDIFHIFVTSSQQLHDEKLSTYLKFIFMLVTTYSSLLSAKTIAHHVIFWFLISLYIIFLFLTYHVFSDLSWIIIRQILRTYEITGALMTCKLWLIWIYNQFSLSWFYLKFNVLKSPPIEKEGNRKCILGFGMKPSRCPTCITNAPYLLWHVAYRNKKSLRSFQ